MSMPAFLKIRRNQLLLGVLALAMAGGAFFFLTKSSSAPPSVAVPSTQPGAPVASPSPSASSNKPPKTVVFSGRNPFQAMSAFQAVAASPSPGASPIPSSSPGSTSTGTLSADITAGSNTVVGGQTVVLQGMVTQSGVRKAHVRVGGALYTVGAGQTFHRNYKVSAIAGSCASILYGDQSFTLCN
jgi:hypothetical protein